MHNSSFTVQLNAEGIVGLSAVLGGVVGLDVGIKGSSKGHVLDHFPNSGKIIAKSGVRSFMTGSANKLLVWSGKSRARVFNSTWGGHFHSGNISKWGSKCSNGTLQVGRNLAGPDVA